MLMHVVFTNRAIVIHVINAADSTGSVGPAITWVDKCIKTFSLAPTTKNTTPVSIRYSVPVHVYVLQLTLDISLLPTYAITFRCEGAYFLAKARRVFGQNICSNQNIYLKKCNCAQIILLRVHQIHAVTFHCCTYTCSTIHSTQ